MLNWSFVGPLQVGTTLSQKYKIERLLAESGGAVLYEATDTSRKQRVWIKIMQRESLANAAAMARFQREAAGSKVLDVGKNDAGLPYMVATEFGPPEKPAMPPRPKPQKTTLPGVAPPPARVPSKPPKEEIEEAALVSLSGSDIVIEETPAPLAPPLVPAPPPKLEYVPDPDPLPAEGLAPLVEDPIMELPAATPSEPTMKRKRQAAAPTVFIDRPKEKSQTGVWVVALVLASIVTGGAGWYFGHKESRVTPTPQAVTTTTVAAATTTETKIPEPVPTPTPTPTITATATAMVTATVTAPTATISSPPPPPRKPPRRPVTTATPPHPPSGDPLTL